MKEEDDDEAYHTSPWKTWPFVSVGRVWRCAGGGGDPECVLLCALGFVNLSLPQYLIYQYKYIYMCAYLSVFTIYVSLSISISIYICTQLQVYQMMDGSISVCLL